MNLFETMLKYKQAGHYASLSTVTKGMDDSGASALSVWLSTADDYFNVWSELGAIALIEEEIKRVERVNQEFTQGRAAKSILFRKFYSGGSHA